MSRQSKRPAKVEPAVRKVGAPVPAGPVPLSRGWDASGADAQLYRQIVECAHEGVWVLDLDGKTTFVNPRMAGILGYAPEEMLGRDAFDFVLPDDVPAGEAEWKVRRGELTGRCSEFRYIRKNGDTVWCLVNSSALLDPEGRPVGVLGTFSDITPYKEAEQALRERTATLEKQVSEQTQQVRDERNFTEAVLQTQAALVLVLDAEGRVVRFNRACEAASGYDFEAVQGTSAWRDFLPAEERPGIETVFAELNSGAKLVHHENHWCHRDGSKRLIVWRSTALRDGDGRISYVIGTGIDISEQRKAEAEARQHLEEASRLQRQQTADQLATMLAHELNQPLAAVTAYAEVARQLLHNPVSGEGRLSDTLEQISQQALRAAEAVRHLRAFVGRGRIDPARLDLNAAVRRACAVLAPQARAHGIDLRCQLAAALPPVSGVDVYIEQVLLNLVNNAIEAIRDGGMDNGSVTVSTCQAGDLAEVEVRDSGPGIDDETAARLFEPFFSRKPHGLGVGLPISRSLIEAQGGRLWVAPHTPGAILRFALPFAA